jgi:Protein of unknown function (DUF2934)
VPTNKEVTVIKHKEISREEVAHRAYELYVQRGEEPGTDVEDWVRAEKELGAEPIVTPEKAMAAHAGQN